MSDDICGRGAGSYAVVPFLQYDKGGHARSKSALRHLYTLQHNRLNRRRECMWNMASQQIHNESRRASKIDGETQARPPDLS